MEKSHATAVEHDGYAFYFWCREGCVGHTANAFDRLLEAVDAADEHRGDDG